MADQVSVGQITASQVAPVFLLAAFEAMWSRRREQDPDIETSQGDQLDRTVSRFRKADQDRIRMASDEVARAHIDRHPSGSSGAVGILIDETKKSRNLKPVRRLMIEAGEAIQRFKPVFMMSPLSVAQYLQPGLVEFDLLVIDEASQVRPEDREIEKLKACIEAALDGREHPASSRDYDVPVDHVGVAEPETPWEFNPPSQSELDVSVRSRGLPPYEFASFNVRSTPIKTEDLSLGQLAYWVTKIVEVEQPIHRDEVGRRLAACCGWRRAGPVIQDHAYQGLLAGKKKGELVRDGDFWFMANTNEVVARDRSDIAGAEWVRKVEMISPIEITSAVLYALHESLALDPDDLVVETARLLGFARVGKDIALAVRGVIDNHLPESVGRDHLGRLRIVAD